MWSSIILLSSLFALGYSDDSNWCASPCDCLMATEEETSLPTLLMNCNGQMIQDFPENIYINRDIDVLDLSFNQIQKLEVGNKEIAPKKMKELSLLYNEISSIEYHFFENFTNLKSLVLSYNNLTTIETDTFYYLKKLTYLDLSFNYITSLPGAIFEQLPLRRLDLSYNLIGEQLMKSKDVLQRELSLSTTVTHLILESVGLSSIPSVFFDNYDNIVHISLADNNLNIVPVLPGNLEYLDLSGNNITFVSANELNYHSLKILHLSRMDSFTSIHHFAFYNLPSLEKLVITDCPNLSEFTDLAFGVAAKTTTEHPKFLSLARNGLEHLNETYKFLFRKMDHIDLRHNPWECDCDILWLQEFKGFLYKSDHVRCASPSGLQNRQILNLTESDLPQCNPHIYGKKSHRILIVVLLATIMVLISVIVYLIRYPAPWFRGGQLRVGPTSPYSHPSESDFH